MPTSDRAWAAVRITIADDGIAGAWAEGQALPLERAITEALREIVPA